MTDEGEAQSAQGVVPGDQAPANDPPPADPPELPELGLHLERRGGQETPHLYKAPVESKDIETKDT
jgi:hypothetical protein